jgi:putative transcriptional regulator
MSQDISPAAAAILEGLNDVLRDVQGLPVSGIRKTVVHPVRPKEIRESLKMSQQEFSKAYGIPLATLRNWEQGRRKLDATALSYLKAIMKFPKEVMAAQLT